MATTRLHGISELQMDIMRFIDVWTHTKKTPVPKKEIVDELGTKGIKVYVVTNALETLIRKGFLRKSIIRPRQLVFIQIRRV